MYLRSAYTSFLAFLAANKLALACPYGFIWPYPILDLTDSNLRLWIWISRSFHFRWRIFEEAASNI